MSDTQELRARVAEACRVIGALELTHATVGHASARAPDSNRLFIRARGPAETGMRYTSADNVIEIDEDGRRVGPSDDGYQAPLEVHIHTELYRKRPDINAVVHVHPQAVVLLTICNTPLLPIYGAYDPHSLRLVLAGVPTFPKSALIERPDLGVEFAGVMGHASVCMMKGHGLTTVANSVEEATLLAIHLNDMAIMTYKAHVLGNVSSIAPEEQAAFAAMSINDGYGGPRAGYPSGRSANLWRYYTRLAEDQIR
jgi:ribulose-5-phosphate 4-epimerase/fuculose-1-phosphate aldolase